MLLDLYCAAIIAVAFGGQAMFGFGGGLIAVPLLSLILDVQDAVILVSIFQFLIGALIFKNYRSVAWSLMPPLVGGMVLGVYAGTVALSVMSEGSLQLILAGFILAFLAKELLAPQLGVGKASTVSGSISGLLGGFFQGCLGMGGPNVVMYLKNAIGDVRIFRASIIFWAALANVVRIPFSSIQGLYSPLVWSLSWKILPVFIGALLIGQKFHAKIPATLYFRVVYAFLIVAACSLVVKSLR
jgi:uncharacterized membrane protein YfcA